MGREFGVHFVFAKWAPNSHHIYLIGIRVIRPANTALRKTCLNHIVISFALNILNKPHSY